MKEYTVTWEIQICADTPREAVELAQEMQRDFESTATVFTVVDEGGGEIQIDLMEENQA